VARAYGTLPPRSAAGAEPLFGPKTRGALVRYWNGAVDRTVGRLAGELARRGL
jgi:hypothetical protein